MTERPDPTAVNPTPESPVQTEPTAADALASEIIKIMRAGEGTYMADALDAMFTVISHLAIYFIPDLDPEHADRDADRPETIEAAKKAGSLAPDFILACDRSPFISIMAAASILKAIAHDYRKCDKEMGA